ncbi:MAG: DEAD/DEAH box helicase [Gammaproteobacteria bacterium]
MTFAQMNLDTSISKAIDACGYSKPTPVQQRAIPEILNGHDVVASAQTGTGKTAAFVLPSLHRLSLEKTARKPRILILTPTRELATQITTAARKYGKFLNFNMASLVGGMSYRQQLRDLSRAVDMIVATPGRLLDHMENRRLDLSGIEMLVLDEADRMLDMGFIDDVQAIAKATPHTRQTLLFSATVDGKLGHVVKNLLKSPIRIDLSQEKISPAKIKQELYMTDGPQHKAQLLQHFLENESMFKTIIFSATKIGADRLAGQLRDQGYPAAPLHGDLKQSMRNRTIEDFSRGKVQFVVATDVAARGIDIPDMTHVINYDLPRFCEDYVHRIGRTGRAGKSGVAISFALPSDKRHIIKIERYIGQPLPVVTIPGLEPTTKSRGTSDVPAKKRGGKPGGFGKSGFGKKSFGKSDEARSGYAMRAKGKSKDAKSGYGKKSFDRSDDSNTGYAKKSYGKTDNAKSGYAKKDFAKSDDSRPGHGKKSFGKSDDSRSGHGKRSFDKSDDSRSGYGKRSFDKSDDSRSGYGKRSFDKSGDSRSDYGKKSFGKSDDSRSGYSKKSFDKSGDSRSDYGKKSFGKSDESRPSHGKKSFGRSEESKTGYGRKKFAKSDDAKSSSGGKKKFGKSTGSKSGIAKVGYAKSKKKSDKGGYQSFRD